MVGAAPVTQRLLRYWRWWRLGLLLLAFGMLAVAVAVESKLLAASLVILAGVPTAALLGLMGSRVDEHHRAISELSAQAGPAFGIDERTSAFVAQPPDTIQLIDIDADSAAHDMTGSVVLVPMARYHVDELLPLRDELRSRGVTASLMVDDAWLGDLGESLAGEGPVFRQPKPGQWVVGLDALVVMNDWDAELGAIIGAARDHGVPTFAKVEGVQDFEDVDVPFDRRPYQHADHILCQGANDREALRTATTHVVGSTRLERIWMGAPRPRPVPLVVINLNFTFGVLEDQRDVFISTAVEGCELSGIPYVISAHPRERADLRGLPVATEPISTLLCRASALVSRFSTVPFEAMALGVPFVYLNPHAERVPTFSHPAGAFDTAHTAGDLAAALMDATGWIDTYRERCFDFFCAQVDIETSRSPAERSADIVMARL